MAIVWSAEYPGQIGVDPGWPHGKPRNISVPGDGTGTPLEAAWVSDLAGWQAALLQEAGITPSGDPDKVGASDYTEAIKAVANANLSNFTSTPHVWTADQTFTSGHITNHWGVQGEVLYCDAAGLVVPKARTVRLPLTAFRADDVNDPSAPGWAYGGGGGLTWISTSKANTVALAGEFRLPAGTVLRGMRAEVGSASPAVVTAHLGVSSVVEGAGAGSVGVVSSSSTNAAGGMISFATGAPQTLTSEDVVRVWFTSSAAFIPLYWAKLLVDDFGPRNF